MTFPRSIALIDADLAAGRSLGAQLCVARHGEPLIDDAFGHAAPGVALTRDMLMLWMSCSKPITALAVAQQYELGRLNLDEPVATYLPDFAQGGKDRVTIRHLLTHTGGFPKSTFRFPQDDWDTVLATICAQPLEDGWIVGETAGYHAATSWFILGELVQRASGELLSDYVRDRIFLPLGMTDCWLGVPDDVYDALADRIAPMWDTTGDEPRRQVVTRRDRVTRCSPAGGIVGPAQQLAFFYHAMLAGGGGIVEPQTVQLFTARHREGAFDRSFNQVIDWGLGFIRDSKRHLSTDSRRAGKLVVPYGFGAHASDETFGHGGNQSSLTFADPVHHLEVAFIFNGMPGEPAHQQRAHDLATAIYEDLD